MFKNLLKKFGAPVAAVTTGVTLAAGNACAALDLTGVTFNMADYEAVALLIIGAFISIWPIKRVIGLVVK